MSVLGSIYLNITQIKPYYLTTILHNHPKMASADKPTTPPKQSDTKANAAARLDGRGISQSPMSKLFGAVQVGAGIDQNKEAAANAITKASSSQKKRKK